MFRTAMTTLLLAGVLFPLHAQNPDWVPTKEAFSIRYNQFEDPYAVNLLNFGTTFASMAGMNTKFERRIHILKETGRSLGEVELYFSEGSQLTVGKASSFRLNEQGEVVASEMKLNAIIREKVDEDTWVAKFTIPDVQVGSIIHYTYERTEKSFFSFTWRFQDQIPTLKSEFSFFQGPSLSFAYVALGIMTDQIRIEDLTYVLTDIPAATVEQYVPNEGNYQPTLRFQLARWLNPQTNRIEPVFEDWALFGKELLDRDDMKVSKGDFRQLAELAQPRIALQTDSLEQARALFRYVQKEIAWDDSYAVVPDQGPLEAFKEGRGTSADINHALVSILQAAGLDAHHALVGTRGHSIMIPDFPLAFQFNTMLAYLRVGGKIYALDATDPERPFELPARSTLNQQFLVVASGNCRWEPIPISQQSGHSVFGLLQIDPNGRLTGKLTLTQKGYDAVTSRHIIKEDGIDAYWDWRLDDDVPREVIKSHQIKGLGSPDSAVSVVLELDWEGYAMAAGDFLYLQPLVVDRLEENPFLDSTRVYPIDFGYPESNSLRLSYLVPEGYQLDEAPGNSQISLPDKALAFTYMATNDENMINVMNKYDQRQSFFEPFEYPQLKQVYDMIMARHGQQLVLKKVQP